MKISVVVLAEMIEIANCFDQISNNDDNQAILNYPRGVNKETGYESNLLRKYPSFNSCCGDPSDKIKICHSV